MRRNIRRLVAALCAVVCFGAGHASAWSAPVLSVADYDGNGWVDLADVLAVQAVAESGDYVVLFDRNLDGVVDSLDVWATYFQLFRLSSADDRALAGWYALVEDFAARTREQAEGLGFGPLNPLYGHGEHWATAAGVQGFEAGGGADLGAIEAVLIDPVDDRIRGIFYGVGATPLFHDPSAPDGLSSLDWPDGELWKAERVQAFAADAPTLTGRADERWHAHAGLCVVGTGGVPEIHQHVSYEECQAYPGTGSVNQWFNLWMVHVWLYAANPDGIFANQLQGLTPDAPSEEDINEGREVPHYFQMLHGDH